MKDQVNIAVLGVGYWGKKLLSEYVPLAKSDPKVNLLMVCDVQEQNLMYCNETLNIHQEKLTMDYKKVLSSNKVDAVHICTPNETHFQICKEALSSNWEMIVAIQTVIHTLGIDILVDVGF